MNGINYPHSTSSNFLKEEIVTDRKFLSPSSVASLTIQSSLDEIRNYPHLFELSFIFVSLLFLALLILLVFWCVYQKKSRVNLAKQLFGDDICTDKRCKRHDDADSSNTTANASSSNIVDYTPIDDTYAPPAKLDVLSLTLDYNDCKSSESCNSHQLTADANTSKIKRTLASFFQYCPLHLSITSQQYTTTPCSHPTIAESGGGVGMFAKPHSVNSSSGVYSSPSSFTDYSTNNNGPLNPPSYVVDKADHSKVVDDLVVTCPPIDQSVRLAISTSIASRRHQVPLPRLCTFTFGSLDERESFDVPPAGDQLDCCRDDRHDSDGRTSLSSSASSFSLSTSFDELDAVEGTLKSKSAIISWANGKELVHSLSPIDKVTLSDSNGNIPLSTNQINASSTLPHHKPFSTNQISTCKRSIHSTKHNMHHSDCNQKSRHCQPPTDINSSPSCTIDASSSTKESHIPPTTNPLTSLLTKKSHPLSQQYNRHHRHHRFHRHFSHVHRQSPSADSLCPKCRDLDQLATAQLPLTCEQLTDKLEHNSQALFQEFWNIPMNHSDKRELPIPGIGHKNRYQSILPNFSTRVILPIINDDITSNYINANHIRGYTGGENAFIATQGPMPHTVNDFWRMVWHSKAPAIVMITKLVENRETKCELYLPTSPPTQHAISSSTSASYSDLVSNANSPAPADPCVSTSSSSSSSSQFNAESNLMTDIQQQKCVSLPGTTKVCGDITVRVLSLEQHDSYFVRRLQLQCNSEIREVVHFWYLAWPDHSSPGTTPQSARTMLKLVRATEACRLPPHASSGKSSSESGVGGGPIVVHCSAGLGRTGCFIAICIGCQQLKHESVVDVLKIVSQMRLDRGGMVQGNEQYEFIHHALAAYKDVFGV